MRKIRRAPLTNDSPYQPAYARSVDRSHRVAWVWIFAAALGAMFLPIGLTLVNLRTRTEEGATRL
jgi:hypothetical protein